MAQTIVELAQNLVRSGLMTAEELAQFQRSLPGDKKIIDARGLARELILLGKLTRYQATAVFQGRTKGLVLGKYVVLDKIGAGGMGQVFKAFDRRLERIVALKLLPGCYLEGPEAAGQFHAAQAPRIEPRRLAMDSAEALARFQREAKVTARLQHPNIVTVFDADAADGVYFLAMEYIHGRDLAVIIKEHHPLPVETVIDYLLQVARGLEYAHGQGVVHRDIKPANLMLDERGVVKILDMGIARLASEVGDALDVGEDRLTHTGQVIGTVDYMSPEQAEDTRQADERSDIYALGCTLHALLMGRPPFGGDTLIRKLLAHRETEIPWPSRLRSDVPPVLSAVFSNMMAKHSNERSQSISEVIAQLEFSLNLRSFDSEQVYINALTCMSCRRSRLIFDNEPDRGNVIENSLGMKLMFVPPGDFEMGSPQSEEGRMLEDLPQPQSVKGFYLGAFQVTQEEYTRVLGTNPSHFREGGEGEDLVDGLDTSRFPVECVSWDDAQRFCFVLSALPEEVKSGRTYRLPTEIEWEYACRAGTTTAFHFGDVLNGHEANCNGDRPYGTAVKGPNLGRTTAVGSYEPNAFGLYDMHGNVCEWCAELWGVDSDFRSVARGGTALLWPFLCRSACRLPPHPTRTCGPAFGLRVACELVND